MIDAFTRRAFCRRLAGGAGALIVGFDPEARSWASDRTGGPLVDLPRLDGALVHDAAVLDQVSQDNGRIVRRRPLAVLRPGSVDDIVGMVRYANTNHIRVAMRGQGHSSFGQAQVEAGIVIDSRPRRRILRLTDSEIDVEAGATWDEVAAATLARGRTPPVMADTQVITVGGTLSVAGMGNTSHRHGAIVDNVRELEVVTGGGRRLVCSETRERELFQMVLAGLGQCAMIVRARLRLVAAPSEVALLDYDYADLDTYLADQRAVAGEPGRYDHVGGRITPRPGGPPRLRLTAGTFQGPGARGKAAARNGELRGTPASPERRISYLDYLHRTLPLIERGKTSGSWWWPSPSMMLFVAGSDARAFVAEVLADPLQLEGTELFDGFTFFANPTRPFTRPLLPFPREPVAFQAWLIRRAPAERVPVLLEANLRLAERVRAKGGTRYAGYGAVPFTPADWASHYGPATWARLAAAKRSFDPANVLTPGPGMF
jgi:cytokinin dehydrogenase